MSIPYYTKHLCLFTTFLLPAVVIIHWSSVRPCKVFPFNRKKRSLSKPLTEICYGINERWEMKAANVRKNSASYWNCWRYLMKKTKWKLQKFSTSIFIWLWKIGLYPFPQNISVATTLLFHGTFFVWVL